MNPTKKVKIGEAIRNQRKNQGLTLNELGQRMGISGSLVGQYERGVVNPKYETIIRFADALNVEPREILGNAFMDVISPEVERLAHSVDDTTDIRLYLSGRVVPVTIQERLIEAFSELNKEGQKVAVERVKELTQIPKYQKAPAGDSTQSAGTGDENDPE
jgi:transcriptional regulator with XRE-family HTH domain